MNKYTPINVNRNKHYGSNYFEVFSYKLKRNVRLFSELEYYNFLVLEMNSDILTFCEQPLKIDIEIEGKVENSIFDIWVLKKKNIEEFQEVKYSKDLKTDARTILQINKQKLWCEQNGYTYSVKTETDIILSTYYIGNLKLLFGALKRARVGISRKHLINIQYLLDNRHITILEIIDQLSIPIEQVYPTIALGIYEGILKIDLLKNIIDYYTEIESSISHTSKN